VFIDILPQSRQSYFQLHGRHHADATENAVTMHRSGLDVNVIREVKYVTLLNSEGDSHYQAGDFNKAIISYTTAIRKILNTDGDDTALLAHFRSLSQRSEAYLALSNFEQAHTDARNALDLYNNCGYYFFAGLHPGELAAAIDRVKLTMLTGVLHAVGNSTSVAGHSSHKKKSFHRRCQWVFI
jgi:tetratricopeptide (TPR) repeat protein